MYPQNGLIRGLRRSKEADCASDALNVCAAVDVPQTPATTLARRALL